MNRIAAVVFFAFLAVSLVPMPATAWKQTMGRDGGISWSSSCYFYSIQQDGSQDLTWEAVVEVVHDSYRSWQDVECSYFYFKSTMPASVERTEFNLDSGNANLIVWRETSWDEVVDGELVERDPSIVALTSVMYDKNNNEILDADIEVNGVYHAFGVLPDNPGDTFLMDLQSVLTHEIGHTVGLDHSSVAFATMAPYGGPGDIDKRTLESDDIAGLCTLYPLDDNPEICGLPYCGLDLVGDSQTCIGEDAPKDSSRCEAAPRAPRPSLFDVLFALSTIR